MVQITIVILFILLAKRAIKQEEQEYKNKYGMTKKDFIAMRKRMNPEFKITLKQWLQDLSKN
jgi:hypothetical protein